MIGTPSRPQRRLARTVAASAAALALAGAAQSQTQQQPRWSIVGLGDFGRGSVANGINDAGQVVGHSFDADGRRRAFLWQDGVMADLGTLGGANATAFAINNRSQVTGWADAVGGTVPFLWQGGAMSFVAIDFLNANASAAFGTDINDAGQIVGMYIDTLTRRQTPFRVTGDTLETYGFGLFDSVERVSVQNGPLVAVTDGVATTVYPSPASLLGYQVTGVVNGLNDNGLVTGRTQDPALGTTSLFISHVASGGMQIFSLPGGSEGLALNAGGQVVGQRSNGVDARAVFVAAGRVHELDSLLPPSTGWTLNRASGINGATQIVGTGQFEGRSQAFLMSLEQVVWEKASSGVWDDVAAWSYGSTPQGRMGAAIDPASSLTVTLPRARTVVGSLILGGDAPGAHAIATLDLGGGVLELGGGSGQLTVQPRGQLTGEGTVLGTVVNAGTVHVLNLALPGSVSNQGLVTGQGRLSAGTFVNQGGGQLLVASGQSLRVDTQGFVNAGRVDLRSGATLEVASGNFTNDGAGQVFVQRGELRFAGQVANLPGGRLQLDGALVRFDGGLSNEGQLLVSFGGASVFGAVSTGNGGQVIVSGLANATFYDPVEVRAGGELRVSPGAHAVFFGPVALREGAVLSGGGTKFYEGGLSIGNSPGRVVDAGDVVFGSGNVYLAEIGGTQPGSQHDQLVVGGRLSLGGTLRLVSWEGFVATAGQSYDLFDWATLSGSFDRIDATGLLLGDAATLDVSRLYVDGTVAIASVPEPGAWALLLAGALVLGGLHRRRRGTPD